ncbi:MAG: M3 family oligoendopeptidase [Planctomycetales bacterium]|nr:M3 family oligoendopeptidase [Planctomycetales bacterium]
MTTVNFSEITSPTPTAEGVSAEYAELFAALDAAQDRAARLAVVRKWDTLRRRLQTWESLVSLRFERDTRDPQAKADRDYADALRPQLTDCSVKMMRRLLAGPLRDDVAGEFGPTAIALWESEVLTFDPSIQEELIAEARLGADYTEILAAAQIEFQGEKHNLSGIVKFRQEPDRNVRHGAEAALWNWFADSGEKLDAIFDRLVQLRTLMARKLGFADYVAMGYKRMNRIDYGRDDVERYRQQVREHIVPLCRDIRAQQAQRLGLEKLFAYDEPVFDPAGNPKPQGDHDWMIERAKEMFDAMGGGLGEFFRMMADGQLMDLKNREGKAGGGFCTSFPTYGVPYIFANFIGAKGDVEVFTHEIGHAFQCYESRNQPLMDYLWPTYESCEIHSMSLEFLTWPHMEKFFGPDDGQRFRRIHLAGALLFLPYGVAVDEFQHWVYEHPQATPSERHAAWKRAEATYLPDLDWDDLSYPAKGGRWQHQRHIYTAPFYYIDYTLAQCCALQFWLRAEENFEQAMADYVALCRRGGEAPFRALAAGAGLKSPFDEGALAGVAAQARCALEL